MKYHLLTSLALQTCNARQSMCSGRLLCRRLHDRTCRTHVPYAVPSTCEAWQELRTAVSRLIRVQKILLTAFLLHVSYLLIQLLEQTKSSRQNQKRTQQKVMSTSGFSRSFVRRYFTCDARRYSTLRSTLIPDSYPASKTGRALSLCSSSHIIRCKQAERKTNIRIQAGHRRIRLIYERKQAKIIFYGFWRDSQKSTAAATGV